MIYDDGFEEEFAKECPYVSDKARDFMRSIVTDIADTLTRRIEATHFDANLDVISGMPHDGYFPYTDGGCEVVITAFMAHSYSNYYANPKEIQDAIDQSYDEMNAKFCAQHDVPTVENLGELQMEYEDFCEEWENEDDDCYFYKVRAFQKEGRVKFYCMLNTDFNYGRDSLLSAGLPHVDPNSHVTEKSWPVDALPDPDAVVKELLPVIYETLGV